MAGTKQHHIPQSLQRGFLFDTKTQRTFLYRRNAEPVLTVIKDVAVQRFFYSRLSGDGSKTLDDEITEYEAKMGGLLIKLRATPVNGIVEASDAAEVIAHLAPRTANMRQILSSGTKQIIEGLEEAFADEGTFARLLGLDEPEPSAVWNNHVDPIFEDNQVLMNQIAQLAIPKSVLNRIMFMATKELLAGAYDPANLGITETFAALRDALDDLVRRAHNKALKQGLVAEPRRTSLEALEWHIRAAPPEGALLPDCVVLAAEKEGGTILPYMLTEAAKTSAVIMPLTSEKLLVGVRPGHIAPSLENFNGDGAACSERLFISATNSHVFSQLITKLGERWHAEISAVVKDALTDQLQNKKASVKSGEEASRSPSLIYELEFVGFGDRDIVPISEKTQELVTTARMSLDLSRLDGITFASPFGHALNALDRGQISNTSPEYLPDHLAYGASTVVVMRDDILRVRIILNAEYGISLAGEHKHDAAVALHLLMAGLVQASTLAQIETERPGLLMNPVMINNHDGVMHLAVRKALRAYRCARASVGFGVDEAIESEFSRYVFEALNKASTVISKAKKDHFENGDLTKFLVTAHRAVADILTNVARLIGHRHGMGRYTVPATSAEVGTAIASLQLTNWFEVFGDDLERFWEQGAFTHGSLYGMNIHAERIMWANKIFVWPDQHGSTQFFFWSD